MSDTSQAGIAAQMIQALSVVEPDLDTSIGTTVRNIIDVEAEQISQAYADNDLSQYQYDINTLTGSALDAFCTNFGFSRLPAQTATGVATFTQVSSATALPSVTIPAGTLISTNTGVVFQTVATYTLVPIINQNNSIDIPIQATVGGANTNVTAGSIINFNTPISGINSVTNANATSGGTDAESDTAFRSRFKATVFRSLTGTAPSFLGVALDNPAVTAANVIGAVTTHQEQITLTGSPPTGTAVVIDAASIYPTNQFMALDLSASSSQVASGSFVLGAPITGGVAITSVSSQTNVTLNQGTILTFGSQSAFVSAPVSSSMTVPISSFTPSTTYALGYTVNYVYNSGGFLTPGLDFTLTTAPLLANPTTAPSLGASGSGSGLAAGTYYYKYAFANFAGTTTCSAEASITITAGQNITVTIPALPTGYPPSAMLYTFIYRWTATGAEQLVVTMPSTGSTFIDSSLSFPQGPQPTSNTTGVAVTVTGQSSNVTDQTYQVQFNYIPSSSRNNASAGVLNCVDLYVAGQDNQQASQVINFYYGPMVASGLEIAPSSSFVLGATLTGSTTYTSVTASTPQTLMAGTYIYPGGTQGPAIVNTNVSNATTIPINSFTPSATVSSGATVFVDAFRFNGFPSSPMYVGRFQRLNGNLPQLGSRLIPLAFGPLLTLPPTLVSPTGSGTGNTSPVTYSNNSQYQLVNETDNAGMSNQSISGIEWLAGNVWGQGFNAGTSGSPTNVGTAAPMSVVYTFNAVPLEIYQSLQKWRLLSHDVMVHQAYPIELNVSLVVVFASGAVASTVQPQINAAIDTYIDSISFGQVLEASQILAAVLGVSGVLNARYAIPADGLGSSGIQSVTSTGSIIETFQSGTTFQTYDIPFTNTTYPVFNQTNIKSVAQNAFTAGVQYIQPI